MPIHFFNNFGSIRIAVFKKKAVPLENHSGRAKTALNGRMLYKRLLQRMKRAVLGQTLNGNHFLSGNISDGVAAGMDRFVVDEHRADTALVCAAAVFRACQLQVCAQHPEERSVTIRGNAHRSMVKPETYCLLHGNDLLFNDSQNTV